MSLQLYFRMRVLNVEGVTKKHQRSTETQSIVYNTIQSSSTYNCSVVKRLLCQNSRLFYPLWTLQIITLAGP
jgi:hypothetical protein